MNKELQRLIVGGPFCGLKNSQVDNPAECPNLDFCSNDTHPLDSKCIMHLIHYTAGQVISNKTSLDEELRKLEMGLTNFVFSTFDFNEGAFKRVVGLGTALELIRVPALNHLRLGERTAPRRVLCEE